MEMNDRLPVPGSLPGDWAVPVDPIGFGEILSQAAMAIHHALHPLSVLIHSFLGVRVPGDTDLAMWAMLAWLLGSREGEAAKKLGLVVAAALARGRRARGRADELGERLQG